MTIIPLVVQPLTKAAFRPFGDVIETEGAEVRLINNGTTRRFHDLANVDVTGEDARVLINIFRGQAFAPPVDIVMLERHPLGSQAFVPLQNRPFLVVVAEDDAGRPGMPVAFLAWGHQGVNYGRNVWHLPLISLEDVSDFLVVDRGGAGDNLEEFFFDCVVYRIEAV
ncbi:ureidoglycolate lyase [Phyllobacterium sp. 628]|uniref:ureidoglycolate lyase n=1 Tax=Phyllobacterium sp. 628 TaxID=2718938 RepID=UPI0016628C33|nr:ureidoglycolate lyase [Phyllobacterium sp. 628]QND52264.1 ureidoglycolate lyase [Phyllobacterium sp. 628]